RDRIVQAGDRARSTKIDAIARRAATKQSPRNATEGGMAGETVKLAEYAAGLRYEDLPKEVIAAAKDAIIDTIAACICGSALPWSRIIIDYAERTGPGGTSRILGRGSAVQAPAAGLANGALAHAFELDSLTRPGAGAHPGATVLPPA